MFETIAVIGAGNMGSGIAQKAAQEGMTVWMLDMKQEFLDRGLDTIKRTLHEGVKRKIFSEQKAQEILARVKPTLDHNDLADCDLIIEAVFEDFQVKVDLFARLDDVCKPHTILATNTSSFSVAELAQSVKRTDRLVGLHFFYHPAKNRFLEIIPVDSTSPEVTGGMELFARRMSKVAVVAKDHPGFVVNRFFVPMLNEAVRILEDGQGDIPTIDKVVADHTGSPVGPFALMNMTGIPIAYHSTCTLADKLGTFYEHAPMLKAQTESGQEWVLEGEVDQERYQAVKERMLGAIFYVALEMLDERTASIEDIEKGAKVALRWRQGPFALMNREGLDSTEAWVEQTATRYSVKVPASLASQVARGEPWTIRQVLTRVEDGIGQLIIARPESLNALNPELVGELAARLKELQNDPAVQRIVLEGEGKAFVAGADIRYFVRHIEQKSLDQIVDFTRVGHELLHAIETSPKPVICKMTGMALGGGAELALACSTIVATPPPTMAFPETGIGIFPGLGGTQRLSRIMGKELAKYFIFTGFPIPAPLGEKLGVVEEVVALEGMDDWLSQSRISDKYSRKLEVPPELRAIKEQFSDAHIRALLAGKVMDEENPQLQKIAKVMSRKAPLALQMANKLIDEGYEMSLTDGLELELRHLKEIFATEDAYEGLSSVGKRFPKFNGR